MCATSANAGACCRDGRDGAADELGLPKGSLQDATVQLFARAGFNIYVNTRSYYPAIDDPGHRVPADSRAGDGAVRRRRRPRRRSHRPGLDRGARGVAPKRRRRDGGRRADRRSRLRQAEFRPRAVGAGGAGRLAVHGRRAISRAARSRPSSCARPRRTSIGSASRVNVEFSWGATEVKPPVLADAIVEVTETGSSLRANRLRIIDTVMTSQHAAHRQRGGVARTSGSAEDREPRAAAARRDRSAGPRRPDAERRRAPISPPCSRCCRRCSGRRSRRSATTSGWR